MHLLTVFANNILPVLLLAGAGFSLGKIFHLDPRTLGRVIFYVFSPLLVFDLITRSRLSFGEIGLMIGCAASIMLGSLALAFLLGRLLRLERPTLMAVLLTSLVGNNGNYGLPIVSFAFGEEALAYASIYFVTSAIMVYTIGVLIASLGQLKLQDALKGLLKVPAIYAIILAMLFVRFDWTLAEPLQRTVTLASGAAIPSMLVLLGLELQRATWTRRVRALSIPVFSRLVASPLIALGLTALFGLPLPARQAAISEAGMPSAVLTTVLATEYGLDSSLVTAIVFLTTLLSPLTLTPLLTYLGS